MTSVMWLQKGLYANRFRADDGKETIYAVYNATNEPITGPILRVKNTTECTELWNDLKMEVKDGVVYGTIPPMTVYSLKFAD